MLTSYIIFLPLIASLVTGALYARISDKIAFCFNSLMVSISAILSCVVFFDVVFDDKTLYQEIFNWVDIPGMHVSWGFYVDSLTALMFVVVNVVSALVHIYSIGYMHHDKCVPKFMSFLSLFTFFMLLLVSANNILQLFVGWEGVGLCSYLLIGFWHEKESASSAAIKAFLVNRIADVAFIIAIFTIYITFGSMQFDEIIRNVHHKQGEVMQFFGYQIHTISFICFMLFIGCMGKSAQLGLHTWLPDAMEGPTPVSALIHAATMVTAGVFLVVRFSRLFEYAPEVQMFIAVIGGLTCVFGAMLALIQNDIKKIIAYSTCSQLGYMFIACGVSMYPAAMFHLATHAFFKALLFLGAGSVIHALHEEQDITRMGGLKNKMPYTYIMMLIGLLALSGIFPFAGYFSKDAIIELAFLKDSYVGYFAYLCAVVAAILTAMYSTRLLLSVFHGKAKKSMHIEKSPQTMSYPMLVLTIGSIFAGYIGVHNFDILNAKLTFWNGAILILENNNLLHTIHGINSLVKYSTIILSIGGIITMSVLFYKYSKVLDKFLHKVPQIPFDEIYESIFVKNLIWLANKLNSVVENIIDYYGPTILAIFSRNGSNYLSRLQSGLVYQYSLLLVLAVMAFIAISIILYLHLL